MLDKVDELFSNIENSVEYKKYKTIGKILEKDPNIAILMQEIKELQKESIYLEANNDLRYKEVEKVIAVKVAELNDNKVYKEYLKEMRKFNEFVATSSQLN